MIRSNWKPARSSVTQIRCASIRPTRGRRMIDPLAARQRQLAVDHEAMRRDVDDMQMHVAKPAMFADHLVVHRMPRSAAHIGYR